jgi:uncharacterized protein (DUF58 family)
MQPRNTAHNYYFFSLLLLGVLLSTISRRLEPLCMVLPLAVVLAYSRLVRVTPVFDLHCTVTPQRAFEGDSLTVQVTIHAITALPPTELWHLLPSEARCPDGRHHLAFTMRAGETRTFVHQVIFARRGKYILGHLYSRVHLGPGLQPVLAAHHQDHVCSIYPHPTSLPRHIPPWHTHASFGHYVAHTAGEGLEFANIRPYSSGDRVRRIHWRTSLKRQQLYVNDYYCERNADVIILLDTLVALGSPQEASTLDIAVRAAASLASHYLQQKDRVGLVTYGGVCTWVLPGSGQAQLHRILEALLEARTHFSYLTKDITLIPPRVLPPGALIFVITTLLDRRMEATLLDLVARAFHLVLIVLSPVQVIRLGPRQAEGTARLWRLETEMRLHELRRLGVRVILQKSDDPLRGLATAMSRSHAWQQARQA